MAIGTCSDTSRSTARGRPPAPSASRPRAATPSPPPTWGTPTSLTSTSAPVAQVVNQAADHHQPRLLGQPVGRRPERDLHRHRLRFGRHAHRQHRVPPGSHAGRQLRRCLGRGRRRYRHRHLHRHLRRRRYAPRCTPPTSGMPPTPASNATPVTQVVNKASTTTTLGSSANPSVTGQPVTFTGTAVAAAPRVGHAHRQHRVPPGRRPGRHLWRRHRRGRQRLGRGHLRGRLQRHRHLRHDRHLPGQHQLLHLHLGARRPGGRPGLDHHHPQLLGEPVGDRPDGDLHRPGRPGGPRVGHPHRHHPVPRRWHAHRHLHQCGRRRHRYCHLHGDLRHRRLAHHHRRLPG